MVDPFVPSLYVHRCAADSDNVYRTRAYIDKVLYRLT